MKLYLCPSAVDADAYPICLKAHRFAGRCSACGSDRVWVPMQSESTIRITGPCLIADRIEYGRERVRDVAKRLASVFSDESRAVLDLRDVADELGAVAALHRGRG